MRKQRTVETPQHRHERLKHEEERRGAAIAENERAVEEMIRQSIRLYGP